LITTDPKVALVVPSVDKPPPNLFTLLGLGITNALCLGIGLGAGWGIDSLLGTTPVFILVGIVVGVAMAAAATWTEVRKFLGD
jgi:hypothetical protein